MQPPFRNETSSNYWAINYCKPFFLLAMLLWNIHCCQTSKFQFAVLIHLCLSLRLQPEVCIVHPTCNSHQEPTRRKTDSTTDKQTHKKTKQSNWVTKKIKKKKTINYKSFQDLELLFVHRLVITEVFKTFLYSIHVLKNNKISHSYLFFKF